MVTLEEVDFGDPRVRALVEEVQDYYVTIYGGRDESPIDLGEFASPRGRFFLATELAHPVAMGGWRWRDDVRERFGGVAVAEIKPMYVLPELRGRGVARQVLAALERSATDAGAELLILETGVRQPEAIRLYEAAGYVAVAPYGHYAWSPTVRCFGKHLRRP